MPSPENLPQRLQLLVAAIQFTHCRDVIVIIDYLDLLIGNREAIMLHANFGYAMDNLMHSCRAPCIWLMSFDPYIVHLAVK